MANNRRETTVDNGWLNHLRMVLSSPPAVTIGWMPGCVKQTHSTHNPIIPHLPT